MEGSQNFGHQHPLVLLNEEQMISNRSYKPDCWRCEEMVSAPCFGCLDCEFYLHKKCAEAPLEINHPFHFDHPLVLLPKAPPSYGGGYICNFCNKRSEGYVYRCSCNIDLHINCALFTYDIAGKNLKELEHLAHEDPSLISAENNRKELEDLPKCFACLEPLANYTYFSPGCGFNLHKKCVDLPLKIKDMGHKHPLGLQFVIQTQRFCNICLEKTDRVGLVYACSACKFVVHIECVLAPPPIVEVKSHQHEFTPFRRRIPFICDACGIEGMVAYLCCICNIIVHKKCISLPCIIKSKWHDHHRIFHTYFLEEEDFESWDCLICHEEVNIVHGCYYCSDCKIIFHVNCVTEDKDSYFVVSPEDEDEKSSDESIYSIIVIDRNNAGEATKIKHLKHTCELMLREKTDEYDKCCEGCMLPVSTSFYYCSHCEFFLHKTCAELPQKKHVWYHDCQQPLTLTSDHIFECENCCYFSSGFSYICSECEKETCLRCVIALTPGSKTYPGHEHPLFYYKEHEGQCSACGREVYGGAFHCKNKGCNFSLHCKCFSLPTTARHKYDKHPLALTHSDVNSYSECHYCDICEERRRDPNHWFYRCENCDTAADVECVLGELRFVKVGSILERKKSHPHPLAIVKKVYYYPNCINCGEPCQDLALECAESGCEHVVYCNNCAYWFINGFRDNDIFGT